MQLRSTFEPEISMETAAVLVPRTGNAKKCGAPCDKGPLATKTMKRLSWVAVTHKAHGNIQARDWPRRLYVAWGWLVSTTFNKRSRRQVCSNREVWFGRYESTT